MIKSTSLPGQFSLVTLSALLLVACGGGGGGGGASSPTPPATYSLIANVSGLSGSGLILTIGNGTNVSVSANGQVILVSGLSSGSAYAVMIGAQPINPVQTCSLTGSSGNVTGSNANVSVACVAGNATTVNMVPASVSIDASVPPSISARITSIVSPIDSQPPGSPLSVPVSFVGGETMVLAIDDNSNIILASLSTTNSINLTVNSTALAIARFAMGALPSTASASQINAAIQATAEFQNLVSLISTALAANTSLQASSAIYLSIGAVLTQLPADVLTTLQQAKQMTVHAQGQPVASPSVTANLPYTLLNFSTKLPQSVAVTGTTAGGDVQVSNSTLIAWSLASKTTSDGLLCLPNGAASDTNTDCSVTIPQTDVLHQLGSSVSSIFVSDAIIAGSETNGGGGFDLTLEQNAQSRFSNVLQITKDVTSTLVNFATAGAAPPAVDCLTSTIDSLLPAAEAISLAANPSGAAVEAYLKGVFTTSSAIKIFFGCANYLFPTSSNTGGPSSFSTALAAFAFGFAKFAVSEISAAATIVGLPAEIYFTVNYWSFPPNVFGVCEAKGPSSTYQISNCANSFAFAPSPLVMVPNDSFTPTLTAYVGDNGTGNQTLRPPDLVYSSQQDGAVINLDANTGAVVALTLTPGQTSAQATITVTETSTGLTANYPITVDSLPAMTVAATPTSIPATGGAVVITATLESPTGDNVGSPLPTGTVQFKDGSGLILCAGSPLTSGVATCPSSNDPAPNTITIASAPDTITANYIGDPNYAPTSATVTVGVQVSNACSPMAGASSCTAVLYSPSYYNPGELGAPVPVVGTLTVNGTTTPDSAAFAIVMYANVSGTCVLGATGCPVLGYQGFSVCSVDHKFVPASAQSTSAYKAPLGTGCNGTPNTGDVVTSYSLTADGTLTMNFEQDGVQNSNCPTGIPGVTQTVVARNTSMSKLTLSLLNGSGTATVSVNDNTTITGYSPETSSETESLNGSWPAEANLTPTFPSTGLNVQTINVPAGQALPQSCTSP